MESIFYTSFLYIGRGEPGDRGADEGGPFFPIRNGQRDGAGVLGIDRVLGMSEMGRFIDILPVVAQRRVRAIST